MLSKGANALQSVLVAFPQHSIKFKRICTSLLTKDIITKEDYRVPDADSEP